MVVEGFNDVPQVRCDFVTLNKRTVEDAGPYKKALLPPLCKGRCPNGTEGL